jgi:hypothetical protein
MSIGKHIQLKPDEKVVMVYRRYGWTYAGAVVITFILLLIPFFLLTVLFTWAPWGVVGFVLLLGIALFYGLRKALGWYHNVCIVTNQRVVDVDQRGFFDRTVSELTYAKIEDVSYRIKGLFATLFRVGTVTIQSAPNVPQIELRRMKHPSQIVDLLNELREQEPETQPSVFSSQSS